MSILAVIPARGGSKRLPGKNIKLLDGRPLLAYSVLVANATQSINHVAVATDSQEIADTALDHHTEIVYHLPKSLTGDRDTLLGTLQLVLEESMDKPEWVVLLQPTCPLRLPSLVERWIQQVLRDPKADGGLTVDKGGHKIGLCDREGYFSHEYEPMTPKTQVAQNKGRENGVFYMFKASNIRAGRPFGREHRMIPFETPPEQSLANVDTQVNWDITELLYFNHRYKTLFAELENNLHG